MPLSTSPSGGSAPSDTAYDATSWDGVTTISPSKNATRDKFVSVDAATATAQSTADAAAAAVAAIPAGPRVLFDRTTRVDSASTDGTEDDLFSDTIIADTITADGQKLTEWELITTVASATAARRIKKYFDGTLIWDSGSLTLALGTNFVLRTTILRSGGSTAQIIVEVISTSASTVPYVTWTTDGSTDWGNAIALKTTGIASGTGAAPGDIKDRLATITLLPAGTIE